MKISNNTLITNDNTLILISPWSSSKITLECLEDMKKYHGMDGLKETLYQLYRSVVEPEVFGASVEIKKELTIGLKK